MSKINHIPEVHPGEVLRDELEERGISQRSLARHIGLSANAVNAICRGKRGINAETALKLSSALGASPQFWLNLQRNWELSQVPDAAIKGIGPLAA